MGVLCKVSGNVLPSCHGENAVLLHLAIDIQDLVILAWHCHSAANFRTPTTSEIRPATHGPEGGRISGSTVCVVFGECRGIDNSKLRSTGS